MRVRAVENYEMKFQDGLGRMYDAKQQFCEMLGIESIVKHSIQVRLQQEKHQKKPTRKATTANGSFEEEEQESREDLFQVDSEAQYGNFSDAELFALAQQCNIGIEQQIHLLGFLADITAVVKQRFKSKLEFRYQKGEQGEEIFYWRDTDKGQNHRIFPLLSEIKLRLEVLKNNMEALQESGDLNECKKDLKAFKKIFKGNPKVIKQKLDKERNAIVEQYLQAKLEKGRMDPRRFLFMNKKGKEFFRVSKDDVMRIYHLLGYKVKLQDIIDFTFQCPFKFESSVKTSLAPSLNTSVIVESIQEKIKKHIIHEVQEFEDINESDFETNIDKRKGKQGLKRKDAAKMEDNGSGSDSEESDGKKDTANQLAKHIINRQKGEKHQPKIEVRKYFQNKRMSMDEINEQLQHQLSFSEEEQEPTLKAAHSKNRRESLRSSGKSSRNSSVLSGKRGGKRKKERKEKELPQQNLKVTVKSKKQIVDERKKSIAFSNKRENLYLQVQSRLKQNKEKRPEKVSTIKIEGWGDEESSPLMSRHSTENDEYDVLFQHQKGRKNKRPQKKKQEQQEPIQAEDVFTKFISLGDGLTETLDDDFGNAIKQNAGNPLLVKLVEIIQSNNMNVEQFIQNIHFYQQHQDSSLIYQLLEEVQALQQKKKMLGQNQRRKETEAEAAVLAANFFNLVVPEDKQKEMIRRSSRSSQGQKEECKQVIKLEKVEEEEPPKKDVYQKLVKALFNMGKKAYNEHEQQEEKFKNLAYLRQGSLYTENYKRSLGFLIEKAKSNDVEKLEEQLLKEAELTVLVPQVRVLSVPVTCNNLLRPLTLLGKKSHQNQLEAIWSQKDRALSIQRSTPSKPLQTENSLKTSESFQSNHDKLNATDKIQEIDESQSSSEESAKEKIFPKKGVLNSDLQRVLRPGKKKIFTRSKEASVKKDGPSLAKILADLGKEEPALEVVEKKEQVMKGSQSNKNLISKYKSLFKQEKLQFNLPRKDQQKMALGQAKLKAGKFLREEVKAVVQSREEKEQPALAQETQREVDLKHYERICWPLQVVTRAKALAKINGQYQSTLIKPSTVLAVAKFLHMNTKGAGIEQETNLVLQDADLLWIPYLFLLSDLPDDIPNAEKYKELKETDISQYYNKISEWSFLQKLESFVYFQLLLLIQRKVKQVFLSEHLKEPTKQRAFLTNNAWLPFTELRVNAKVTMLIPTTYYFNFLTEEKRFVAPDCLQQKEEFLQEQILKELTTELSADKEQTLEELEKKILKIIELRRRTSKRNSRITISHTSLKVTHNNSLVKNESTQVAHHQKNPSAVINSQTVQMINFKQMVKKGQKFFFNRKPQGQDQVEYKSLLQGHMTNLDTHIGRLTTRGSLRSQESSQQRQGRLIKSTKFLENAGVRFRTREISILTPPTQTVKLERKFNPTPKAHLFTPPIFLSKGQSDIYQEQKRVSTGGFTLVERKGQSGNFTERGQRSLAMTPFEQLFDNKGRIDILVQEQQE